MELTRLKEFTEFMESTKFTQLIEFNEFIKFHEFPEFCKFHKFLEFFCVQKLFYIFLITAKSSENNHFPNLQIKQTTITGKIDIIKKRFRADPQF